MASWAAWLVVLARFGSLVAAIAALWGFSNNGRSSHLHNSAFAYSYMALSCHIPGYTVLLLCQGVDLVFGSGIPLPAENLLLCSFLIAMDWALALFTWGTACAAISVTHYGWHRHVIVESVAASYMIHGILGLFSGTLGGLTCLCEMWLTFRLPRWAQHH